MTTVLSFYSNNRLSYMLSDNDLLVLTIKQKQKQKKIICFVMSDIFLWSTF